MPEEPDDKYLSEFQYHPRIYREVIEFLNLDALVTIGIHPKRSLRPSWWASKLMASSTPNLAASSGFLMSYSISKCSISLRILVAAKYSGVWMSDEGSESGGS